MGPLFLPATPSHLLLDRQWLGQDQQPGSQCVAGARGGGVRATPSKTPRNEGHLPALKGA